MTRLVVQLHQAHRERDEMQVANERVRALVERLRPGHPGIAARFDEALEGTDGG